MHHIRRTYQPLYKHFGLEVLHEELRECSRLGLKWNNRLKSIMPLFDVIGLGGEKHAVIIDIGTAYTK